MQCCALKDDRQLEKDELTFEITTSVERQYQTDADRCRVDCTEEKTDSAHGANSVYTDAWIRITIDIVDVALPAQIALLSVV